MLVTITNSSGKTLNDLDTLTGGTGVSALSAVGGARKDPLPYPFDATGKLLAAGTVQRAMHPADWHYKSVPSQAMAPRDEWNQLVQRGTVTMTIAAQTARRDEEELFLAAV